MNKENKNILENETPGSKLSVGFEAGVSLPPAQCKATIHTGNLGIIEYQCTRKAIKDDYCWQHHPAKVKERELHRLKKLEATPFSFIAPIRRSN